MERFSEEELNFIIAASKQCLASVGENGMASDFLLDLISKCKRLKIENNQGKGRKDS
tara:strand:+ start:3332 stop:3502 length:171 start_codon:yes stop_codon:yes gene_type:complete